jgi:hypothetical protein
MELLERELTGALLDSKAEVKKYFASIHKEIQQKETDLLQFIDNYYIPKFSAISSALENKVEWKPGRKLGDWDPETDFYLELIKLRETELHKMIQSICLQSSHTSPGNCDVTPCDPLKPLTKFIPFDENKFEIIAKNNIGNRKRSGGDKFVVSFQPSEKIKWSIEDHKNGKYTVQWKSYGTTGNIRISASLLGITFFETPAKWEWTESAKYFFVQNITLSIAASSEFLFLCHPAYKVEKIDAIRLGFNRGKGEIHLSTAITSKTEFYPSSIAMDPKSPEFYVLDYATDSVLVYSNSSFELLRKWKVDEKAKAKYLAVGKIHVTVLLQSGTILIYSKTGSLLETLEKDDKKSGKETFGFGFYETKRKQIFVVAYQTKFQIYDTEQDTLLTIKTSANTTISCLHVCQNGLIYVATDGFAPEITVYNKTGNILQKKTKIMPIYCLTTWNHHLYAVSKKVSVSYY